jgi:hypothetical protein
LGGGAALQRVTYLPHVRGRRSVQRHQGGDLDQFGQRGPRNLVDVGLGYPRS